MNLSPFLLLHFVASECDASNCSFYLDEEEGSQLKDRANAWNTARLGGL